MTDFDPTMPDESEQLDQLQPDDSLIDRGVADVLDEGYVAPEKWSPAQGYGNTRAEMRHGETLDQRIAQEERRKEELERVSLEANARRDFAKAGRAVQEAAALGRLLEKLYAEWEGMLT